jgi:two-component system, cell cycle response regulator
VPSKARPLDVSGARFLVGRGSDCELTLPDIEASRRHALLQPQADGSVVLEDLGSTNGTFLNDRRVERDAQLKVHDSLRIGQTILRYEE